ncbi:hypothetical protein JVX91_19405 [Pseudomonas sp. PDNC002]|uniref:hypothetical protein n=1 Tax=Pseudomonas sp. PDNC002 TaxID=2811422 RepID=UPI00196431B8|nr:hypothetical protein [Pseudomonas sp. PDNC002]QRY77756.1 hypothetical protein JVX91_19405 [Pseudomonas sp. PDNC002]
MAGHSRTSAFTNRAKTFGNMWRVYSAKCDKSFVLPSDRELAHWILHLEYNPNVLSFDLNPTARSLGDQLHSKQTIFDAEVVLKHGPLEFHEVKMGNFDKQALSNEQIDLQRAIAERCNARYLIFNDSDLFPNKIRIMPLLRVAACLSAGRDCYVPSTFLMDAQSYLYSRKAGRLNDFLLEFGNYDIDLILYVFCKEYLEGVVDVEFERSFFSKSTRWVLL